MKRWPRLVCILFLMLIGFAIGCQGEHKTNLFQQAVSADLPDFISLIAQYSDDPFYIAKYEGGYGFDAYRETGVYPSLQTLTANINSFACSCFYACGDQPIFGRNFDWHENPALLLFTNPPGGYQSASMVDISYLGYDQAITPFDLPENLQYAPYYPFDGMNEHGLAVGMMAVGHAEGGQDAGKVTLGSLELIRLMLDYAIDVPEALALVSAYNVDFGSVPVHYLVGDRYGNAAVIEFLDGEMVSMSGNGTFQVSTNFILTEAHPSGANSLCNRYNRLYSVLERSKGYIDRKKAMCLLKDVSQAGNDTVTRWSVVYDIHNLELLVAINRKYSNIFSYSFE